MVEQESHKFLVIGSIPIVRTIYKVNMKYITQGYLAELGEIDTPNDISMNIKKFRDFNKQGVLSKAALRLVRAWHPVALPYSYNVLYHLLTAELVPSLSELCSTMQEMAQWANENCENALTISPSDNISLQKIVPPKELTRYVTHCGMPYVKIENEGEIYKFHAFITFETAEDLKAFTTQFKLPAQTLDVETMNDPDFLDKLYGRK